MAAKFWGDMSTIEPGRAVRRRAPLTVRVSMWLWLASAVVGGVVQRALEKLGAFFDRNFGLGSSGGR
jgi:hypothetical protein